MVKRLNHHNNDINTIDVDCNPANHDKKSNSNIDVCVKKFNSFHQIELKVNKFRKIIVKRLNHHIMIYI